MDEQHQAEYISLINQLLICPSGQELAILNNNSTLVDAGFVQMLRSVSNLLLEQGRKDAADFLMNIAEQLIRVIQVQSSTSSASTFSNQNSQYVFFQVLLQTAWSNPSSESVYPLLTDNLDKLDNHFIVLLQRWSNASISNLNESIKPDMIAGFIGTLADLFRDFPLGDKAINIEIAIAAYEIAANIFTVEAFPDYWAMLQNSLGKSYLERVVGTRKENVEQAINYFKKALTIHTIIVSPESWAMLQSNLGAAHLERINGDKIDNFEKAITFFNQALTVFSPTNFPEYWAYTHNNLGEAYRDRIFGNKADNLEQAIAHCNQAILIFNQNDFPQQWAIVQNNLGNTYIKRIYGKKSENTELAIHYYQQALLEYTQVDTPERWAMIQSNLGNAYGERIAGKKKENLEHSIYYYNQALLIYKPESFPEKWALSLSNLSLIYSERIDGKRGENLEQAIYYVNQILTVYTKDDLPEHWAEAQKNLGILYLYRIYENRAENLEKSIRCLNQAVLIFKINTFPEQWADTQINLGLAYRRRIVGDTAANLEQAINCYKHASLVYGKDTFPEKWAITQNNLGLAYSDRILGDKADNLEQAINCYRQALLAYTHDSFPEQWADTLNNLGLTYHSRLLGDKLENLERAIDCYNRSLTEYTYDAFPEYWAMVQHNLGFVYSDYSVQNKPENLRQAINHYNQALLVRTRENLPERWAETKNCLGNAYANLARVSKGLSTKDLLNQAIRCYTEALQVYTNVAFTHNFAKTKFNLGHACLENEQIQLAYNNFADAIDAVEVLREEVISGDESKQRLSESYTIIYQYMVKACLEIGIYSQAISYVERSKTRNLVQLILTRDRQTIFPKEVVVQLDQLRDEISSDQYQLQNSIAEDPTALAQHLQQLRQQHNELQDQYLPIGSGFQFEQFRSTLSDGVAVVEFYITTEKLLIFIITKQTQEPIVLPPDLIDLKKLGKWMNGYLKAYGSKKTYWQRHLKTRLTLLSKILHIDEIIGRILSEYKNLILIPHRFLHLLPLHALSLSNGTSLFDRFPGGISYAPSCQLLQLSQKRDRPYFNNLFAIQNPTQDLAYTDIEVSAIQRFFDPKETNVLEKSDATRDTAVNSDRFNASHCIHFSCHGYFNLNSPRRSALILANSDLTPIPNDLDSEQHLSFQDGRVLDLNKCLTLDSIFSLNLDQCRLVTLSACETGLIDFRNISDEYIGLPSGFLYAGARSVVSSLWAVNDLSTALLMAKFYENLQTESSIAIALNQAQCWLRDSTKVALETWMKEQPFYQNPTIRLRLRQRLHKIPDNTCPFVEPFYWAAFCAIGQP